MYIIKAYRPSHLWMACSFEWLFKKRFHVIFDKVLFVCGWPTFFITLFRGKFYVIFDTLLLKLLFNGDHIVLTL